MRVLAVLTGVLSVTGMVASLPQSPNKEDGSPPGDLGDRQNSEPPSRGPGDLLAWAAKNSKVIAAGLGGTAAAGLGYLAHWHQHRPMEISGLEGPSPGTEKNWVTVATRGKRLLRGDHKGLQVELCMRNRISEGHRFIVDMVFLECCREVGIGPESEWSRAVTEAETRLGGGNQHPREEPETPERNQFSKIPDLTKYFSLKRHPAGIRPLVPAPAPIPLGI